ncbi:MAG: N-acetyltransferase [Chloroflexi bacterium]|nr:N-acetyltransferase [Chloroflexota bacterium]
MPINDNVRLGNNVRVFHPTLVNIYGCTIGDDTQIGPFVEVQNDVTIGRRCKIQSHAFLCEGVILEDGVFVGHGVMFVNDLYPRAITTDGALKGKDDWTLLPTRIGEGVGLGSNATILGGITIGKFAMVGAGAVVTKDVPDYAIVAGVPARVIGDVRSKTTAQEQQTLEDEQA